MVRRGGMFYFRRGVPRHLVGVLGRREITASLRTSDIRLGRLRSRRLYVASETLFSALEGSMLSEEVVGKLVRDFYDLVAQIDNMNRLQSSPLSAREHAELLGMLASNRHEAMADLGRGDFSFASLGADVSARRAGLTLDAAERRQLEQAIMRAGIEVIKAAEARLAGNFAYAPSDPILSATPANLNSASTTVKHDQPDEGGTIVVVDTLMQSRPISARAHTMPTRPRHRTEETLSTLTPRFLEHQRKGRLWDAQTILQAAKSYKLFIELCGDCGITGYDRASAQRFKDTLQTLPADYGKAAEFRGQSIAEIERLDGERGGKAERLSTRTVKRHFSALSGFWRWALAEKLAVDNPFVGFVFPSALRANEQRDMWAEEELVALFSTPVWAGCLSPTRRSAAGELVIKDEKYWLPLIALYSGLRQEEIAQLHLEDIRRVDGYLVFDINGRSPRKLKNRNAVRKVPVHSQLIRLGLLDRIQAQQKSGEVLLFSDLKPGGADKRLGHAFSKWFARYRQDVGIYRRGLDFHSFRHTATTLMQRAGVGIAAIDELTGHATPGETARYSHGMTMQQLSDAIETIEVELPIGNGGGRSS